MLLASAGAAQLEGRGAVLRVRSKRHWQEYGPIGVPLAGSDGFLV
jgi:hypothetical protein